MEEQSVAYPQAIAQRDDSRSLLAEATNPSRIIEEFSHRIRGETFDITAGKWKLVSKPKMNEQGINELVNEIFSRVNQNTIFSNLDRKEVSHLIISLGDDVAVMLCEKVVLWDIKEEDMDSILNMCVDLVYMALKRGYDQGERKFLSKVTQQSEHIMHNEQIQKRGILDGIFNKS